MNTPSRITVVTCSVILALTACGKAFGLMQGAGLLMQPHPFLPGTFVTYVWLGLSAEIGCFVILAIFGTRAFLTTCLALAMLFIGYHALEVSLQIPASCPCLGGVLGRWKPLAQAESGLSFLLACWLGISSFVGLFKVSKVVPPQSSPEPIRLPAVLAMSIWVFLGVIIVCLWKGRILGGDEGMEAAKSLQMLMQPGTAERMWNDQPPLWSGVLAGLFSIFGPSLSAGRLVVVLLGTLLPLTWAIYSSLVGVRWGPAISVLLLWLLFPSEFASLMLEAPAYSLGIAALLPLMLREPNRLTITISALIAALALSIKLTAAFALVVPFVWLWQRTRWQALAWGMLAVSLTILGSFLQPGWSWGTMGASHVGLAAQQIGQHRLNPEIYTEGWLVCLLALFAIANRYVTNRIAAMIPWVSAAAAALLIHLFHRPFWDYYNIHLITPLLVLAGFGAVDLRRCISSAAIHALERQLLAFGTVVLCLFWAWQRGNQIISSHEASVVLAASPITKELRSLGDSGHTVFSMDPAWTFAAHQVQTPPELTIIPSKRVWSGQVNDLIITKMLQSNHVDALVLSQSSLSHPDWTNLLAGYVPAVREGQQILFVRRELSPRPIAIESDEKKMSTELLQHLGF